MLHIIDKLTWLVLGGDPAVRSYGVEQFVADWGLWRLKCLRL